MGRYSKPNTPIRWLQNLSQKKKKKKNRKKRNKKLPAQGDAQEPFVEQPAVEQPAVVLDNAVNDDAGNPVLQGQEAQVAPPPESPAESEDENLCVICLTGPKTTAMVRCGHVCMCENCAKGFEAGNLCPICRAPILNTMRVYFC